MKNAKRSDGGQYRLQLRNPSGFDTATVNVKVLDRPSPPENLRADEFGGDALTLFWNPPKDNGGADITNYVIEKKEPKAATWSKVRNITSRSSSMDLKKKNRRKIRKNLEILIYK